MASPTSTTLNGSSLRVFRAMRDMTQMHLAEQVGMSQTRICQIEKNRYQPSQQEWVKIVTALTATK